MLRDPYFLIPMAGILALAFGAELLSRGPSWFEARAARQIEAHIRNASVEDIIVVPQHTRRHSNVISAHGGPVAFVTAPGMKKNHVLICYIELRSFGTYIWATPAELDVMGRAHKLDGRIDDAICEPFLPPIEMFSPS